MRNERRRRHVPECRSRRVERLLAARPRTRLRTTLEVMAIAAVFVVLALGVVFGDALLAAFFAAVP